MGLFFDIFEFVLHRSTLRSLVLTFSLLLLLVLLLDHGKDFPRLKVFKENCGGRRDHIGVPAHEEHQVTGMSARGVLL